MCAVLVLEHSLCVFVYMCERDTHLWPLMSCSLYQLGDASSTHWPAAFQEASLLQMHLSSDRSPSDSAAALLQKHTCTRCQSTRHAINQTCHFNSRLHLSSPHDCVHDHYVHYRALRYKLMLRDKHTAYQKHSAQFSRALVQLIFI